MSRTRKQYNQFRSTFKKWWGIKKDSIYSFEVTNAGCLNLYDKSKKLLDTYCAPDYTKYMKYIASRYLRARK